MNFLALLIPRIPGYIANWVYPRAVKAIVADLHAGGVIKPEMLGNDLVQSFDATPDDQDGPLYAFRMIVVEMLGLMNIPLEAEDIAPLMVALGQKVLADPDFAV